MRTPFETIFDEKSENDGDKSHIKIEWCPTHFYLTTVSREGEGTAFILPNEKAEALAHAILDRIEGKAA